MVTGLRPSNPTLSTMEHAERGTAREMFNTGDETSGGEVEEEEEGGDYKREKGRN